MTKVSPLLLSREEFPEQSEWIDRLFRPINNFSSGVAAALSGAPSLAFKEIRLVIPATAYTAPTFTNSWVNFGGSFRNAGYRIDQLGFVELTGAIKNGTMNASAFTLPAGYRPPESHIWANYSYTGAAQALAAVQVVSDGTVVPTFGNNTEFHLDGVRFAATSPASPETWSSDGWPIYVAHGLSSCDGLLAVSATIKEPGATDAVGHFTLDWADVGDGRVKLKAAWGLTPGKTYFVNLMFIGEA